MLADISADTSADISSDISADMSADVSADSCIGRNTSVVYPGTLWPP